MDGLLGRNGAERQPIEMPRQIAAVKTQIDRMRESAGRAEAIMQKVRDAASYERWKRIGDGFRQFGQGFSSGFLDAWAKQWPKIEPQLRALGNGLADLLSVARNPDGSRNWSAFGQRIGETTAKVVSFVLEGMAKLGNFLVAAVQVIEDLARKWRNLQIDLANGAAWATSPARAAAMTMLTGSASGLRKTAREPASSGRLYQSAVDAGVKTGGLGGPITVQQTLHSTYHIHGASTADAVGQIGRTQRREQAAAARGVYADLDLRRD